MRRCRRHVAVTAWALCALAAVAFGQDTKPDWRGHFGSEAALTVEQWVHGLFPGARVDWGEETAIVMPTGERRPLRLAGFSRRPVADRVLAAACLDFPAEIADQHKRVRAFAARAATSSTVTLLVSWTKPDGTIVQHRTVKLPVAGAAPRCSDVKIAPGVAAGAWPELTVAYGSAFSGEGWWGWADAYLTVDSAKDGAAAPPRIVRLNKGWRDGREALRFVRPALRASDEARAAGAPPPAALTEEQRALVLEPVCAADPCELDARALLEALPHP
jgi:hypothetical protein